MDRIAELRRICFRRFRSIALVLAIGLPLVVLHANSEQPLYEAEARIQFEYQPVSGPYLPNWIVPQDGRRDSEVRPRDTTENSSPGVATDETGRLHRGPRTFFQFAPEISAAEASRRLLAIERRIMEDDALARLIAETGILAGRDDLTMDEKNELARRAIEIAPITLAELDSSGRGAVRAVFAIRVHWDDPQMASRIADEIVAGILDRQVRRRTGRTREETAFFQLEQLRLKRRIAKLQEEIARFREKPREPLPDGRSFRHNELARLDEAIHDLDQSLLELEAERLSIRIRLAGSAASRAPGAETRAEEAILRNRLEILASQVRLIEARKAGLDESRRKLVESLKRSPAIQSLPDSLNRRLLHEREMLDAITRRLAEGGAGLILGQRGERFRVLQHATVSHGPVVIDRRSILLLGTIFVFAFAIALAVLIDRARPRVRSAAEIERLLGVRPLVSLPHVARRPARRRGGSSRDTAAA